MAFNRRATESRRFVPGPPRALRIEATQHGEWARLKDLDAARTVFYCHGGGYVWGDAEDYREFAARLARKMSAEVFLLNYRLAPAWRCPAPLEDALAAWDAALERGMDPARTVIAGDSAGGGLALATMMALRDRGDPLPAAAFLMSPWTDLSGSGESLQTRDAADPMLGPEGLRAIGALYAGDAMALNDWRGSPLFGDHTGLPPVLIQTGDREILLSDSARLHEKLKAAGVSSELRVWDRMYHVWQLGAFFVPEGRRAIEELAAFVERTVP